MEKKVIFLHPYFDYKIWGGNKLKEFGYLGSEIIGEALMISTLNDKESTVIFGFFDGKKLSNVFENNKELFGNFNGPYPLLTKIIDANDDLSVQVHPDNDYAMKNFGKLGKTECWYILDCPPNSKLVYGSKEKDINKIKKYIDNNEWDKFLNYVDVKKGDVFYVPSGTIHAITKGILTYEIQQSSDLTFRLFDYNRIEKDGNKRELHIKDSLKTIKVNDNLIVINGHDGLIIDSDIFKLDRYTIRDKKIIFNPNAYWLECLVIEGEGIVEGRLIKKGTAFIITHNSKIEIIGNVQVLVGYIENPL
ncbi:MAG: class I mannose-6-phosphate isomerase [Mycoplasmataceae bacterium]|nr:class I mannose-6-phosphate isomerase [Mycoplasmataceae bacterium]